VRADHPQTEVVMAELTIEDAYLRCCAEQFRDRKEWVDHVLGAPGKHRDIIAKQIRQHARMWAILKRDGNAITMRERLDAGEMDWWKRD
jgi:hypothetical protein